IDAARVRHYPRTFVGHRRNRPARRQEAIDSARVGLVRSKEKERSSMRIDEIDAILRRSFDDRRLSRGETRALREVFADALRDSASRHHARQAAFAIFKETLRDARDGEALEWLESVVKLLDSPENERTTPRADAFFSPGE